MLVARGPDATVDGVLMSAVVVLAGLAYLAWRPDGG